MSRKSKKGFRKLEDHEMAEFTKLNGEESGSDSEIIELARESNSRWGGVCCWCVALYLLLVTCFLVLMAMVAVYFGYNMMRISGDYNQRLNSLEDKIGQLSSQLSSSNEEYTAKMKEMKQMVAQVNHSLLREQQSADKQRQDTQQRLTAAEKNLEQVQGKIANFESHPPTIGKEEIQKMRSSMAAFKSTIESYDSQFIDIKQTVGDARHEVTQTNDRVELLRRNVSSLRSNLSGLHLLHQDTSNSLDLASAQISALQTVVHEINETLNQAVALSGEEFNKTQSGLEGVQRKLSSITQVLSDITSDIDKLNVTATQAASHFEAPSESTSPPTEPTTGTSDSTSQSTEPTSKPGEPTNPPTKPATNTTQVTLFVPEPTPSTNKPTSETTRPTTESTSPATEPASEPTNSTTKPTSFTIEHTYPATERIHSTAGPTVEDIESNATHKTLAGTSVPPLHGNQSMNVNSSTMFSSGITAQPSFESDDDKTSQEGDSMYGSETPNSDTPSTVKDSHTTTPPFDQTTTTDNAETNPDSTGATEDMPAIAPDIIADNATNETETQQPTASTATPLTPTQHGTSTLKPPTVDSKPHSKTDILLTLQDILNTFDTLDTDINGYLSMQELSEFFPDGISQSVTVLFNDLDRNQDSIISRSEVQTLIQRIKQNGTKSSVPAPSPGEKITPKRPSQISPTMLLQDILKHFVKFDFNQDFALNLKEFSALLKSSPRNVKVLNIFRKLDFNRDNFLTEQEITHALSQFPTENPTQEYSTSETVATSENDMDSKDFLANYMKDGKN